MTAYHISVYLHVLAAMTLVGGMLFMSLVFVPLMRKEASKEAATETFRLAARRFQLIAPLSLLILAVTGFVNLKLRFGEAWMSKDLWTSSFGGLLAPKIALVVLIFILGAIHDQFIGPRAMTAMRERPEEPATHRLRKAASWIGRVNLVLLLVVLALAVLLVRPW